MATSSITHNFVISNPNSVKLFIAAIDEADRDRTSQALKDLYNIRISHQQVANYARTAALVIKPFVDNYNYKTGTTFIADETYIKVRGIKGYIWFIMDAVSRFILGYQVSDNRGVGP